MVTEWEADKKASTAREIDDWCDAYYDLKAEAEAKLKEARNYGPIIRMLEDKLEQSEAKLSERQSVIDLARAANEHLQAKLAAAERIKLAHAQHEEQLCARIAELEQLLHEARDSI